MTLTKAKLAELRRIRDGATPGPWTYDIGNWEVERTETRAGICGTAGRDDPGIEFDPEQRHAHNDGEYIAAFDPPTTGELLSALERCREALLYASCPGMDDGDFHSKEAFDLAAAGISIANQARTTLREVFGEDAT